MPRTKLTPEGDSGRATVPKDELREMGLVDENGEVKPAYLWWRDADADERTAEVEFRPIDD